MIDYDVLCAIGTIVYMVTVGAVFIIIVCLDRKE